MRQLAGSILLFPFYAENVTKRPQRRVFILQLRATRMEEKHGPRALQETSSTQVGAVC